MDITDCNTCLFSDSVFFLSFIVFWNSMCKVVCVDVCVFT